MYRRPDMSLCSECRTRNELARHKIFLYWSTLACTLVFVVNLSAPCRAQGTSERLGTLVVAAEPIRLGAQNIAGSQPGLRTRVVVHAPGDFNYRRNRQPTFHSGSGHQDFRQQGRKSGQTGGDLVAGEGRVPLPGTGTCPTREPQLLLREWYGGKVMDRRDLRETLRAVTRVLTPDGRWCGDRVTALLMETAAVETGLGEIVRQKEGPAVSPWQLLNMNYREIPRYFSKRDPELMARAMTLYNHSKSREWNRVHNIPWTAAISLLHYEQASGGTFMASLGTLDQRARLWKKRYNTYLGRGSVSGYKKRAVNLVYLPDSGQDNSRASSRQNRHRS